MTHPLQDHDGMAEELRRKDGIPWDRRESTLFVNMGLRLSVNTPPLLFDRRLLPMRRRRASGSHFLLEAAGHCMSERLVLFKRRFARVLVVGQQPATLDFPDEPLRLERFEPSDVETVPFAPQSFDAVLSACELHWINDLPGVLSQIKVLLKPDGLLLAAFPGGETLKELRSSLLFGETESEGRVSPRVAPFVDVRDAGDLLTRVGFALPVADCETLNTDYDSALSLMHELRAMGETNLLRERRKHFTRRSTLMRANAIYQERFATQEGRVKATFQLVILTAWAPAAHQPRPLPRGSGRMDLRDALKTTQGSD